MQGKLFSIRASLGAGILIHYHIEQGVFEIGATFLGGPYNKNFGVSSTAS